MQCRPLPRRVVTVAQRAADGEIRLAGHELHDVDEQGYGADLLDPDPRRGGGSKGEVRWGCLTIADPSRNVRKGLPTRDVENGH
jgi:hypothetical protein